jgi:hypothetical protein
MYWCLAIHQTPKSIVWWCWKKDLTISIWLSPLVPRTNMQNQPTHFWDLSIALHLLDQKCLRAVSLSFKKFWLFGRRYPLVKMNKVTLYLTFLCLILLLGYVTMAGQHEADFIHIVDIFCRLSCYSQFQPSHLLLDFLDNP